MAKSVLQEVFKPAHSCFVDKCKNKSSPRPGLTLFSFPKDPSRCQEWLKNLGRPDLFPTAMKKDGWKICEDHFEPSQFMDPRLKGTTKKFKRLIHCGVPTLFDHFSGQKVVTTEIELGSQRKLNSSPISFVEKYKNDCKYQPEVRLYRLPKDILRSQEWVQNIDEPDLSPEVMIKDQSRVSEYPFLLPQSMDPHLRGAAELTKGVPSFSAAITTEKPAAHVCLVENCKNRYINRPGITLFCLPKDPIRCQKWVKNIGRPDLLPTAKKTNRWRICEDHFAPSQFMDPNLKGTTKKYKRLIHCGVPTLFD